MNTCLIVVAGCGEAIGMSCVSGVVGLGGRVVDVRCRSSTGGVVPGDGGGEGVVRRLSRDLHSDSRPADPDPYILAPDFSRCRRSLVLAHRRPVCSPDTYMFCSLTVYTTAVSRVPDRLIGNTRSLVLAHRRPPCPESLTV